MNIKEIKDTLNYLLDNNLKLAEENIDKIAVCIEGRAGIGKTAIVKQVAEERGCGFTRINLSECEEVGDIIGSPVKEYLMYAPNKEEQWVAEKAIEQFISLGYEMCTTCNPRTSYATPAWVPNDPEAEHILLLDDFSRASELFMQAIMSLIQFGEYISWKLPKKCHLVLSSNPDNGNYSVTGLDPAQKSRLLNFDVEFDVKAYAEWMENMQFKSEFINFALVYPEIFNRNEIINARSYSLFANACRGLSGNISSESNLVKLKLFSKAAFGDEYVSGLFIQFIANNLDQLISPDEILNESWAKVKERLTDNIYRNGKYDASIASILSIRFTNYVKHYFDTSTEAKKTEKACNRIIEICTQQNDGIDKKLLTEDLIYKMLKHLNAKYPTRCSKLIQNPQIRSQIMK